LDITPTDVTDVFCVLKGIVVKSGLIDNSPEQCPPRIAGAYGLEKERRSEPISPFAFLNAHLVISKDVAVGI
jgi:hypothetical protein